MCKSQDNPPLLINQSYRFKVNLNKHTNSGIERTEGQTFDLCQGLEMLTFPLLGHTCSGLSPGGTQAYSSSGQPLSSSEVELRLGSWWCRVRLRSWSIWLVMSCDSGGHLQCLQIFLEKKRREWFFISHSNDHLFFQPINLSQLKKVLKQYVAPVSKFLCCPF